MLVQRSIKKRNLIAYFASYVILGYSGLLESLGFIQMQYLVIVFVIINFSMVWILWQIIKNTMILNSNKNHGLTNNGYEKLQQIIRNIVASHPNYYLLLTIITLTAGYAAAPFSFPFLSIGSATLIILYLAGLIRILYYLQEATNKSRVFQISKHRSFLYPYAIVATIITPILFYNWLFWIEVLALLAATFLILTSA